MTLAQWLADAKADEIAAMTDAYFRDQAERAKVAFQVAFMGLQADLPIIDEKGQIQYKDGRAGTYALNEDIQQAIAPILRKWGFTLHFETSHPHPNVIAVDGVLTHKRGHQRRSRFESGADTTGGKSVAQGRGSILSYGHRYTTIDLLNLVTRGVDDDGAHRSMFGFDPSSMPTDTAKATFRKLMDAAMDRTLDECWKGLDTHERASIGVDGLHYIKTLAEAVR